MKQSGTVTKKVTFSLFFIGVFFLGFFSNMFFQNYLAALQDASVTADSNLDSSTVWRHYKGEYYRISYPDKWALSGPSEGPVSGFPEYLRLISQTGDLSINIGLEGDNRFEYVDEDILEELKSTVIEVNGNLYPAEEKYLALDEKEISIVILEVLITDKLELGINSTRTYDVLRPFVVQIYYRLPKSPKLSYEDQLKSYEAEKVQALEVVKTLRIE